VAKTCHEGQVRYLHFLGLAQIGFLVRT